MLIQAQTDYTSPDLIKHSNSATPLVLYVRGNVSDLDVGGGSVTIEVYGEDGEYHTYNDLVFTGNTVENVYLHYKAQYRVVIAGMTNPVDVEIR